MARVTTGLTKWSIHWKGKNEEDARYGVNSKGGGKGGGIEGGDESKGRGRSGRSAVRYRLLSSSLSSSSPSPSPSPSSSPSPSPSPSPSFGGVGLMAATATAAVVVAAEREAEKASVAARLSIRASLCYVTTPTALLPVLGSTRRKREGTDAENWTTVKPCPVHRITDTWSGHSQRSASMEQRGMMRARERESQGSRKGRLRSRRRDDGRDGVVDVGGGVEPSDNRGKRFGHEWAAFIAAHICQLLQIPPSVVFHVRKRKL
ncbi:hypothetical protein HZH68_003033 [Vespula germanica]|uniref:Uncharacterized protein n=1 Tax=Vespula germanica TaxID=30212 RepID=A0A834NND5_VESGE|nr:hypothetical protein HZH68_003033 [Vespula germanica]